VVCFINHREQLTTVSEVNKDLKRKLAQGGKKLLNGYHNGRFTEIPTGVNLQSLNFESANDVYMKGII